MFPNLPKWPAFAVAGDNVTPEQAAEIIIRTDTLDFCSNDKAWKQFLYKIMGVQSKDKYSMEFQQELFQIRNNIGSLNLNFLANDQIASAYIGGPKGWCHWNGTIGCNNFNIGKWPSCEAVLEEWSIIAQTFPFLNLRCQLFSAEYCEENPAPVIEYIVRNGNVDYILKNIKPLPIYNNVESQLLHFLSPNRERGCSPHTFADAFNKCKNKHEKTS